MYYAFTGTRSIIRSDTQERVIVENNYVVEKLRQDTDWVYLRSASKGFQFKLKRADFNAYLRPADNDLLLTDLPSYRAKNVYYRVGKRVVFHQPFLTAQRGSLGKVIRMNGRDVTVLLNNGERVFVPFTKSSVMGLAPNKVNVGDFVTTPDGATGVVESVSDAGIAVVAYSPEFLEVYGEYGEYAPDDLDPIIETGRSSVRQPNWNQRMSPTVVSLSDGSEIEVYELEGEHYWKFTDDPIGYTLNSVSYEAAINEAVADAEAMLFGRSIRMSPSIVSLSNDSQIEVGADYGVYYWHFVDSPDTDYELLSTTMEEAINEAVGDAETQLSSRSRRVTRNGYYLSNLPQSELDQILDSGQALFHPKNFMGSALYLLAGNQAGTYSVYYADGTPWFSNVAYEYLQRVMAGNQWDVAGQVAFEDRKQFNTGDKVVTTDVIYGDGNVDYIEPDETGTIVGEKPDGSYLVKFDMYPDLPWIAVSPMNLAAVRSKRSTDWYSQTQAGDILIVSDLSDAPYEKILVVSDPLYLEKGFPLGLRVSAPDGTFPYEDEATRDEWNEMVTQYVNDGKLLSWVHPDGTSAI